MADPVYTWRQAIDGGGFQNAFAIADNDVHTSYQNLAISGADVAGFHRTKSRNTKVIWDTSNRAIFNSNQNCTTSMEFSKTVDGKLFVLTGRDGNGGLLISDDAGITWKKCSFDIGGNSDTIKENGMNSSREVGRHICADASGNHLWVAGKHVYGGSKRWGIAHSSDQGATFTGGAGFAMQGYAVSGGGIPVNATVRCIIQDPTNSNTLYVGVDGLGGGSYTAANNCGGLYKITNAKSNAPTVQKIAGPGTSVIPTRNWVRDGVVIKEGSKYFLYFIAGAKTGTGGSASYSQVNVFKYELLAGGGGATISLGIEGDGLRTDSQWVTIDGYRNTADTATTIWIGCWQGSGTKTGTGVAVSRNGGSSWNGLVGANYPNITKNMPSGREYWMFDNLSFQFNKSNYDCACIRVDPNNPNIVFSAGRGGVWCTQDNGTTWKPAMQGLAASMSQDVAYNPSNKNQWVQGNVDWAIMLSKDRFTYGTMPFGKAAANQGENSGYAFQWTTDGIAVATGGRGGSQDDPNGVVMSADDPVVGTIENQDWRTTVSKANRPRVLGIAYGRDASGKRVIIAIAQKKKTTEDSDSTGIWRKVITSGAKTGTWTRAASGAFTGLAINNSWTVSTYWHPGSSYVYTYDRVAGKVWRSSNYGADWTSMAWTSPSTENGKREAGYIAGYNDSVLYIATGSNVYKVSDPKGAFTATALPKPAGLTAPGAVATDDSGNCYIVQRFVPGKPTGLWMYPASGGAAVKLSTTEFEQKVAMPNSMIVMTETTGGKVKRTIGVSTWGNGMFIGEAAGSLPPTETFTKFQEDFENDGTPPAAGAAVTTTNSNFGAISGTVTFTATAKQEDRAGSFSVGATAGVAYGESPALESTPQYALDFYFQVTSLPSITTRILVLMDENDVGFTGLQLTAAGKLVLQDGTTSIYTSTATLAVGQWYRVAVMWDAAGPAQLKIWSGANLLAKTPTEDSGAKTYANTTNTSKVRVGLLNAGVTNSTVLFDDIMTKDDGTWPDRGFVDMAHTIVLGFMPMGIS